MNDLPKWREKILRFSGEYEYQPHELILATEAILAAVIREMAQSCEGFGIAETIRNDVRSKASSLRKTLGIQEP